MKKNGKNQSWSLKLKCKKCLFCFVARKKRKQEYLPRTTNIFENYIREGYSSRQIADQEWLIEYRVRLYIQSRLDHNTITCISEIYSWVEHIMIDGYWLPKDKYGSRKILLVYYAYTIWKVIWFSIRDGERKEYIAEDLRFLRDHMGYMGIISCTADWWIGIATALKEIYPACLLQRCLVHIQRQVKTYISGNPKSRAGKEFLKITEYDTLCDPLTFPQKWKDWNTHHQAYINEKSIKPNGWWRYAHGNLKKAIRHIENALPYMFQSYRTGNPDIERSSNKLEWYFWVFAEEWIKEHKGLSHSRLYAFTSLWISLRNQK